MDDEERALARTSLTRLLEATGPAEVTAALVDGGWTELLATDAPFAFGALGEAAGRTLHAAPLAELGALHTLGLEIEPDLAVVLPPYGTGPGPAWSAELDQTGAHVRGTVVAGTRRAKRLLVAAPGGLVTVDPQALEVTPVGPQDPDLGLVTVTGTGTVVDEIAGPERWADALDGARRVVAAELIGLSRQVLDDTVAYVSAREQYGRAIGSFQTVKHRLADVHVAISAAHAGLGTAWLDGTSMSATAALLLAARAQHLAATHGHQVHGGIAFTVDHGFYRFIRRGQLLGGLLGHPDDLLRSLGATLAAGHHLPRSPDLATPAPVIR